MPLWPAGGGPQSQPPAALQHGRQLRCLLDQVGEFIEDNRHWTTEPVADGQHGTGPVNSRADRPPPGYIIGISAGQTT